MNSGLTVHFGLKNVVGSTVPVWCRMLVVDIMNIVAGLTSLVWMATLSWTVCSGGNDNTSNSTFCSTTLVFLLFWIKRY